MSSPHDTPPGNEHHLDRMPPVSWAFVVTAVTFAIFARAIGFEFLNWDDPTNIYQNPHLTPTVTVAGLARLWSAPYFELYMPLTDTVWAACARVARLAEPVPVAGAGVTYLDARVFHAAGVLGHSITAALVFLLLRRLTRHDLGAVLGALLWALHPVQVESVAWATGNNNVFSGLFALVAFNLYLMFAQEETPSSRRRWLLYAGATVAYVLALLCKPTAVAVPLLALALDTLWLRRSLRSSLAPLGLWFAIAFGWALLTRSSSETSALVSVPLWQRPLIALDALAFYLFKVTFPVSLTLDYGRSIARVVGSWWAYANAATIAVLVAALGLLWRRGNRWPVTMFALLALGVLPMLGLVPFYFMRMSTVADRYLYLGMLGPAFAVAAAVRAARPGPGSRAFQGVLLAVVTLFGLRTFVQLPVWRDSLSLFSHAVRVNPQSPVAHNNLGIALSDRGDREGALSHAAEAVRLQPDNADFLNNLGIAYAEKGDLAEAAARFAQAVAADPELARARYHLGAALADLGRREEAVPPLQEAVRLDPDFEEAWFLLGVNLARTGKSDAGERALARVADLNPRRTEALYIRGVLLGNLKRLAEAEQLFAEVIRRTPDYAEAHYNLGLMRERQGRPVEAVPAYTEALRLAPTDAERALFSAALKRVEAR